MFTPTTQTLPSHKRQRQKHYGRDLITKECE